MLDVKYVNDKLQITIEDDGVGRVKAKSFESKLNKKKSFGTQITADRLMHFYGSNYKIEFIDKQDNGVATGTIVHIKLPIKLKHHAY